MNLSHSQPPVNESTATRAAILKNLRPIWIPGPEDIVIDHGRGWAYVSSQSRPRWLLGALPSSNAQQGAIFGLDLKQDRPQPINLTDDLFASQFPSAAPRTAAGGKSGRLPLVRPDGGFHPAGISLYQKAGSANRLFAVNGRSSAHRTVEIFEVEDERIVHLRTVEDEQHLISPNDLVAVGDEQFYVTNDHAFSNALLQYMENSAFRYAPSFHSGSVSYFDGEKFTTVAQRLSYPNGITVARKTTDRIYMASLLGKELLVAEWNKSDPSRELSFTGRIPLPCFPDNLEWDADGNLWLGAHSDFAAVMGYTVGLRTTSPSCVLRISGLEGTEPAADEIWADSGAQLSSASVAGVYKRADGRNLVLIGAAFDDHMLLGELHATD